MAFNDALFLAAMIAWFIACICAAGLITRRVLRKSPEPPPGEAAEMTRKWWQAIK